MWHSVEVDLSAKAEAWTLTSAVAVADGEQWVCFVPSKVKQRLRAVIISRYGAKNLQYRVFALIVYIALRPHLWNIQRIVLDQDYEGPQAESTIKNLLLHLVRSYGVPSLSDASEMRIGLQLAQEELAQLLGASRQRVNQELKSMERDDVIRIEQAGLVIRNRQALMHIIEADV